MAAARTCNTTGVIQNGSTLLGNLNVNGDQKLKDGYPEITIKFEMAQYRQVRNVVVDETAEFIVIRYLYLRGSDSRAALAFGCSGYHARDLQRLNS